MTQKEIIEIFLQIGWKKKRSECIYDLGDRFVQILPKLKILTERDKLALSPCVSTVAFQSAIKEISGLKSVDTPIVGDFRENDFVYSQQLKYEDIVSVSDDILRWASGVDIVSVLESFREIPTNAVGDQSLKHLTALALLGDSITLDRYKRSFASGDRLGFIPLVTADFIDRALIISERNEEQ